MRLLPCRSRPISTRHSPLLPLRFVSPSLPLVFAQHNSPPFTIPPPTPSQCRSIIRPTCCHASAHGLAQQRPAPIPMPTSNPEPVDSLWASSSPPPTHRLLLCSSFLPTTLPVALQPHGTKHRVSPATHTRFTVGTATQTMLLPTRLTRSAKSGKQSPFRVLVRPTLPDSNCGLTHTIMDLFLKQT
jgi:hypothetical protein